MYPAYPFLCLNAALTLHFIAHFLGNAKSPSIVAQTPGIAKAAFIIAAVLLSILLGISRTLGTVTAYSAPMKVYEPLRSPRFADHEGSVCLGKEWYRFPSSYHLGPKMRAHFVKSEFHGLLPGQFAEEPGLLGLPPTWIIPPGMNDQNLEDTGKHVSKLPRRSLLSKAKQ